MKVTVRQEQDFHFVGTGPSGREVPIDAAEYVGGKGRGVRPPELMFHAIASCVGIHLYEALVRDGKTVDTIEISTDADRRTDDYPKVFTAIRLDVRVRGDNVSGRDVDRGLARTVRDPGTCSLAYMIDKLAPISWTITISSREAASG